MATIESSLSLQEIVDEAAIFNLLCVPTRTRVRERSGYGITTQVDLHRFEIALGWPSVERGVAARNTVGQVVGQLELNWSIIPYAYMARPDRQLAAIALDPDQSQRFVMQEMVFRFGHGADGFRSFGTGRTFPIMAFGRPKIVAAAIGNLTEGFGKFSGYEGNFTLCGELIPDCGYLGHIVIRIIDPQGRLRTTASLPPLEPRINPDPEVSYVMWVGQKGTGPQQENRFSLGPDGEVRGVNIATESKLVQLDFAVEGPEGFRCANLQTGDVIGGEIGCGRGAVPDAPPTGTALSPFTFEGVAQYSFRNKEGRDIGAITTNVLEGRRFDVTLPQAPAEPATRFGFFGPIVDGSGYFRGAQGMLYGASASVFKLPPEEHVVTHVYLGRLEDPEGRFRAAP
jgi:hypothetical protein